MTHSVATEWGEDLGYRLHCKMAVTAVWSAEISRTVATSHCSRSTLEAQATAHSPTMPCEPDADGFFRCTTPGCSKQWWSVSPIGRTPILRNANGSYSCSGCSKLFKTARLLQAHFGSKKDESHTGKVCIASPKKLLSCVDFKDYTRHMTEKTCWPTKKRTSRRQR